ncbi:phosphonoacetaldehyde hydrolase [Anaerolineae bacterium CFX9]|nr:phosphonoacetaldehyde hydrolase [Anaerolineae bacterium CFX9]
MGRVYTGRVQGIVLDWAGTIIDHGCIAPSGVFVDLFAEYGVVITSAEAREPMGRAKRDHIAQLLGMPAVAQRWAEVHGSPPSEADVDRLYAGFGERQIAALAQHAQMIPGVVEALNLLRASGIRIGTCTGYTRPMMDMLAPLAAGQGFIPDAIVTSDEVPSARPSPLMCYLNAVRLNVYPLSAMIKVGDTLVDIEEGLNAGMWVVAVTLTGNEVGMTEMELRALPDDEIQRLHETAARKFRAAGAHIVLSSAADLPAAVEQINARLARGERP